jgi:tetrapyrrole methylase family protein/MazG family protein
MSPSNPRRLPLSATAETGPVPGRVVVIGLGPAGADLLTASALSAIEAIATRFVRTTRHPAVAQVLAAAPSFDYIYDQAERIEDVYPAIVEALVEAATTDCVVLYAVPGSPLVAEHTVELLRADRRVTTEVLPALSFLDLVWNRLGVDPLQGGVRLVDGHRFATEAAGERGPLLVGQCDSKVVLSEIKLALDDGPTVTVLQRLGLADEEIRQVAWEDLDRVVDPDHLTSLWIPELATPVAAELVAFGELVRTLRQRCPWDRAQTHASLSRHLLEETYETLEAINRLGGEGEGYPQLEEELGDLLFQVFLHATLAAEQGQFDLADVARGIREKLVRRHPHVFAPQDHLAGSQTWEELKRQEKGRTTVMDGVSGILPGLLYAHQVQRKAAAIGFDWKGVEGAWPKVAEEQGELRQAIDNGTREAILEELGDLLFAVVNVSRHLEVDPEAALRHSAEKFRVRVKRVEETARAEGFDLRALDLPALDRLWEQAKAVALSTGRPDRSTTVLHHQPQE